MIFFGLCCGDEGLLIFEAVLLHALADLLLHLFIVHACVLEFFCFHLRDLLSFLHRSRIRRSLVMLLFCEEAEHAFASFILTAECNGGPITQPARPTLHWITQ